MEASPLITSKPNNPEENLVTDHAHLVILGIAAVIVGAILTVGTLAAADLLPSPRQRTKDHGVSGNSLEAPRAAHPRPDASAPQ